MHAFHQHQHFLSSLAVIFGLAFLSPVLAGNGSQESPDAKLGASLMTAVSKHIPASDAETPNAVDKAAELAKQPEFVTSILKWKTLNSIPEETLKELANAPFMKTFLGSAAWQQAFFGSGPNPNPDAAIRNLALICSKDPKAISHPLYRKLATATALEFARQRPKEQDKAAKSQWNEEKMLERYQYFRSSHAAGLLNPMFDKLDYWDMRILAGCTHAGFGAAKSLKWQRDNVRLPAQNYTGACWQAPYRLNNEWGDSIHGADYYKPFDGLFPGATAQMTREVGAVCGGLSHFGAYAAIANGIPALPMGEPGHCAYTVRVDGRKWVPGYSLSTERGCHWNFYSNRWVHLILMQDMFSDKEACARAFLCSWAAEMARQAGNTPAALVFYKAGLRFQPANYPVWQDYLATVKNASRQADQWQQISRAVKTSFSAQYPEVCWELLDNKIYPSLMPLLTTKAEKLAEIADFHKSLVNMTPISWNLDKAMDKQISFIGSDDDTLGSMIDLVVATHMKSDDYGSAAMKWCMQQTSGRPELLARFVSKISGEKGDINEKAMTSLADEMVRTAAKAHDIATFQMAGKLMKQNFKPSLPAFGPFPGELLSSGGMLQLSSMSDRFGQPWRSWGVIEPCGGHFHTDNDDPATATVTLPKIGDISGIVIVGPDGHNASRCDGMIIETSLDGITWTQVGSIPKTQKVNRIDLAGKQPRARQVRITRPGKNFFHLNGILVYGKKAS